MTEQTLDQKRQDSLKKSRNDLKSSARKSAFIKESLKNIHFFPGKTEYEERFKKVEKDLEDAKTKAESADSKADVAIIKAETADTKAEVAKTEAEVAKTEAEDAKTKAEDAKILSNQTALGLISLEKSSEAQYEKDELQDKKMEYMDYEVSSTRVMIIFPSILSPNVSNQIKISECYYSYEHYLKFPEAEEAHKEQLLTNCEKTIGTTLSEYARSIYSSEEDDSEDEEVAQNNGAADMDKDETQDLEVTQNGELQSFASGEVDDLQLGARMELVKKYHLIIVEQDIFDANDRNILTYPLGEEETISLAKEVGFNFNSTKKYVMVPWQAHKKWNSEAKKVECAEYKNERITNDMDFAWNLTKITPKACELTGECGLFPDGCSYENVNS